MGRGAGLGVVVALAAVLAGCGGSSSKSSSGCPQVSAPKPRSETRKPPATPLDASKPWAATVDTSCGSFMIELDVKGSPHTAASFVSLAQSGFFDDTTFHRIVPGFVIQGGDPTATGGGGPGYSVIDKPPAGTAYPKGVVAMAKTQTEPAGTSGSQFFVVTGDASFLTPVYAVLGTVVNGMPVVDKIGKLGDPKTEQPTQAVVVNRITISNS